MRFVLYFNYTDVVDMKRKEKKRIGSLEIKKN